MEERTQPKKLLLVANVVKEHVLKFHVPTIKALKARGWTVDVAASGEEDVPCCDHQIRGVWKRSPFTLDTLRGVRRMSSFSFLKGQTRTEKYYSYCIDTFKKIFTFEAPTE